MSELEGVVVREVELLEIEVSNAKTDALRLEELSRHPDSSVQLAVAGNPNTSSATLEHLGRSRRLGLLRALAKHPNTPPHLIERLARHRHDSVRYAVAESAQISETVALQLLDDISPYTRSLLIERSDRFQWDTTRLFERAAKDSSWHTRMNVAQHATVSSIIESLLDDADPMVARPALCNRALAPDALTAKLETMYQQLNLLDYWFDPLDIVRRRDLPSLWLERFATHPIPMVRLCIVKNPNTPRSVLLGFADDPDMTVMMGMATMPDLPESLYMSFAQHPHPYVRSMLVKNPAIPRSVLELLARNAKANPKPAFETWDHHENVEIARKALKRLESVT